MSKHPLTYFITGATGFIGEELLRQLPSDATVYALVRDLKKAPKKGEATFQKNIIWIEGDLCDENIVFDEKMRETLKNKVNMVLHLGAAYDLTASHESMYNVNVIGTRQLIHFSQNFLHLKKFIYASTMAVSGDFVGEYQENMFDVSQGFPNSYASTKFAAEADIRNWKTDVQRIVLRLGIVVGRSSDGWMPKVDGPYYLLKALQSSPMVTLLARNLGYIALPFDEKARPSLVPVDEVAEAFALCAREQKVGGSLCVYHIMGPNGGIPIRTVLKSILKAAGLVVHLWPLPKAMVPSWLVQALGLPDSAMFYFYSRTRYSVREFQKDYPDFISRKFEEYSSRVFSSKIIREKK